MASDEHQELHVVRRHVTEDSTLALDACTASGARPGCRQRYESSDSMAYFERAEFWHRARY